MKQSKNLGISKACPNCRKTLLRDVNVIGEGNLKTKCPHCKNLVKVEIHRKVDVMCLCEK